MSSSALLARGVWGEGLMGAASGTSALSSILEGGSGSLEMAPGEGMCGSAKRDAVAGCSATGLLKSLGQCALGEQVGRQGTATDHHTYTVIMQSRK